MAKKVLVLGKDGMLGSMVYHHLTNFSGLDVSSTTRRKSKSKNIYYLEVYDFLKSKRAYS